MRTSNVIKAIEAMWCEMQYNIPDLPDVLVAYVPSKDYWGWAEDDHSGWLTITEAAADAGADIIFGTVFHEAVHILAKKRGIVDTFGANHNHHTLAFAHLAESVGLRVKWRNPEMGYDTVKTRRAHRRQYRHHIEAIEAALDENHPSCKTYAAPDAETYPQ